MQHIKQGCIIDCVSDLHGALPKLTGGDILIVAGDMTARHKLSEWQTFFAWLGSAPYQHKIYIAGNHDDYLQDNPELFKSDEIKNMAHYLCDSGIKIEGFKIWGSPWTKTFEGMNPDCKAFTVDTENELEEKFEGIPFDTDILITHSPPLGILDLSCDGENCGSDILTHFVWQHPPRLHVFGHIHEGYGVTQRNGTIFVNASQKDVHYNSHSRPVRIIL